MRFASAAMAGAAVIVAALALAAGYWLGAGRGEPPSVQRASILSSLQPEASCDPAAARGCLARGDGYRVRLRLLGKAQALEPFDLSLEATPVPRAVEVRFVMRGMDMGENLYVFARTPGGWRARAILPVCSAGRSDWIAELRLHYAAGDVTASLPFRAEHP